MKITNNNLNINLHTHSVHNQTMEKQRVNLATKSAIFVKYRPHV